MYCTDPKEQFNAVEFKELIEQVDVNKIKGNVERHLIVKFLGVHVRKPDIIKSIILFVAGIWRSTTDETDSDQVEHTWKKIAQATAEANMELFREIVERCSK